MTNSRRTFLKTVGLAVGGTGVASTAVGTGLSGNATVSREQLRNTVASTKETRDAEEGWTHWHHGPANTSYNPYGATPTGFETAWTKTWDNGSTSPPVVADGTMYFVRTGYKSESEKGEIYAVDTDDGSVEWTTRTKGSDRLMLIGDTVYKDDSFDGVQAFDSADGSLQWSRDDFGLKDVIGDDSGLYVTERNTVTALDHDGTVRWTYEIAGDTDGALLGETALKDGTLVVSKPGKGKTCAGRKSKVLALDAETGQRTWATRVEEKTDAQVVIGHGNAYATAYPDEGRRIFAFDLETGEKRWELDYGETPKDRPGTHVPIGDTLYALAEKEFAKIDPSTGEVTGTLRPDVDGTWTDYTAAGDTIYFSSGYENDGAFYAIDRHDGTITASMEVPPTKGEGTDNSLYTHDLVVNGDRAYTAITRYRAGGAEDEETEELHAFDLTE